MLKEFSEWRMTRDKVGVNFHLGMKEILVKN
jgi:hypothetical protein